MFEDIIPAFPGFFVAYLNDMDQLCKEPVIAWGLTTKNYALEIPTPITIAGAWPLSQRFIILQPNGEIPPEQMIVAQLRKIFLKENEEIG